jgi:predicted ATPase
MQSPAIAEPETRLDRALEWLASLNDQLRARSVYRALVTYLVASVATIGVAPVVVDALHLSERITSLVVLACVAGLPVTITVSWFYEFRRGRRRVFVAEAGMESEPAPLPAAYINNLAPQPTPFVGREREVAALQARLADAAGRLVTITGPGGVGKSRLALEAAGRVVPEFTHGVCVVALAEVPAAELVAPAVVAALRLQPAGGDDALLPALDFLREKKLLLVLDDFGHLAAAAPVVGRILDTAPGVQLLVTSRQRLGLPGELLFALGGMQLGDCADGGEAEAVRLFLDGARRVVPGFAPDADELACIVRICALVEGLPLAIELASPWVRMLAVAEIEAEIRESQKFLAAEGAAVPTRHRSLRTAFESSWRNLEPAEQCALRRLSVFRGGFARAAAAKVAGADLSVLSALADRSLVRPAGPGRFEMLEVVRTCAADELAEDPDEQMETRRLHAEFYAGLMRQVTEEQRKPVGEHALRDAVAGDLGNVRAATEWSAQNGHTGLVRDLLAGAFVFYDSQGRAVEGEECFSSAVRSIQSMSSRTDGDADEVDQVLGLALARTGVFLAQLGRTAPARECMHAAYECACRHGDSGEIALSLQHLAGQAYFEGEYEQAVKLEEEALGLWQTLGDARGTGRGFTILGNVAYARGDHSTARWAYGEAVKTLRAAGDPGLLFAPLCNLGIIASVEHDWTTARRLLGESLDAARKANNPRLIANALQNLGAAAWESGDYEAAEKHLVEAVEICRNLGFRRLLAFCLNALGNVYTARGELERAAETFTSALVIADDIEEAPLTLEIVLGFARLRRAEGHPAEAAKLAALLGAHPATDQAARQAAEGLSAELAGALEPAELEDALERGRSAVFAEELVGLREGVGAAR